MYSVKQCGVRMLRLDAEQPTTNHMPYIHVLWTVKETLCVVYYKQSFQRLIECKTEMENVSGRVKQRPFHSYFIVRKVHSEKL